MDISVLFDDMEFKSIKLSNDSWRILENCKFEDLLSHLNLIKKKQFRL